MSSAGKRNKYSLREKIARMLLREEQHPYSTAETAVRRHNGRVLQGMDALEAVLPAWIESKGYWKPHRTISEAAADIGTDSTVLHWYFIERMGEDFRTWRTRMRIADAREILLEEPLTPAFEIGMRVGFLDRSNFSRQFSAHVGMSPSEWRRRSS